MNVPNMRRTVRSLLALVLVSAALLLAWPAGAQTHPAAPTDQQGQTAQQKPPQTGLPEEVKKPIARLTTAIETAEKALQQLSELEEELSRLRLEVEEILSESVATAEELRPQLAAVRSQ